MHIRKLPTLLVLLAGTAIMARGGDQPRIPDLSLQQLRNMTYHNAEASHGVAELKDGKFVDQPDEPGSATRLEIRQWGPIARGDLNGDGASDAAVLLISDPGGSGTFANLAVVINENGHPRHVASVALGDRVKILNLSIKDQVVTVQILTQGPNDPMNDPTMRESHSYKLKNGTLREGKE